MITKEYKILIGLLLVCVAVIVIYAGTNHSTTITQPAVTSVPKDSDVIPMSIVSIKETASSSPRISAEYPQFSSLPAEFNEAIASSTMSRLDEFKSTVAENIAGRRATARSAMDIATSSYTFTASWQPAQMNGRYVSFVIRFDSYVGGANENQDLMTFNYGIASGTPVTLAQLFPNTADPLKIISRLTRERLQDALKAASPGYDPDPMLEEGTVPTEQNFSNFTFTDDTIIFYFPKYAVAPGAFGEQKVTLSRDKIK